MRVLETSPIRTAKKDSSMLKETITISNEAIPEKNKILYFLIL